MPNQNFSIVQQLPENEQIFAIQQRLAEARKDKIAPAFYDIIQEKINNIIDEAVKDLMDAGIDQQTEKAKCAIIYIKQDLLVGSQFADNEKNWLQENFDIFS